MSAQRSLQLCFASDVPPIVRRRLAYAFRVFCAIYGYEPVEDVAASGDARICYGIAPAGNRDIAIPAVYTARPSTAPVHAPSWVFVRPSPIYAELGLASVPCFFSSANGADIDWLGEVFEWLSCADEYSVVQRDEAGRIPFEASVHGRFDLDPTVPYAAVAMYELNRCIRDGLGATWPERPVKPWAGAEDVIVAPTHDLDYLPTGATDNVKRIVKNVAIAALIYRDPPLVLSIGASALKGLATLRSPLDCVDEMSAGELEKGIRSTSNVISCSVHKRDANYSVDDPRVKRALRRLADDGMEIALHGSYTSLEHHGLRPELESLAAVGHQAVGVRQHWLRFVGDTLFEEIVKVGLKYDSTVGFSQRVGFRAGACFPYPPYDFRREQAYAFVEIPLVIMDVALYEHVRHVGGKARALCQRVLDMIAAFGWGGVTILWHNTVFRGAQLPPDIGRMYWELKRPSHRWTTAQEVAQIATSLHGSVFPSAGIPTPELA